MKQFSHSVRLIRNLPILALAGSLALPLPALSATLNLATAPLANSTTTTVLPNLMFIIDGSGSMDWNYLPDWADNSICKNTNGSYNLACTNQPLFQSPDFNGIYYNPAIRYLPAVNADGTSKPIPASPWTSVKNDAYNIQSTSSTNLTTSYVDIEWCTDGYYTDCLRNGNYILPGVVNGTSYTTMHTTTSSGTRNVLTGPPDAPVTTAKAVGPHYYTITPGEYCNSERLTTCQTTPGGAFTFPAKLRWCNTTANANAVTPAANSCQALRTGSFTVPRFPTRFFTPAVAYVAPVPAVPAVPGVRPTGLITFGGTTTSSSSTPRINDDLSNSQSIRVGSASVYGNDIDPGNSKTPAQVASYVVSKIGTGGTYQAYIGGSSITPTCAAQSTKVVCIIDTSTWTNGSSVSVGSRSNFGGVTVSTSATAGGVTPVAAIPAVEEVLAQPAGYYGSFVRTDIVPGNNSYPYPGSATKAAGRDDCAGTTCTYAEEMTNFASWWTYYQTRMQAMKTSVSRAFKPIDNRYRVGFIDLWGNNYLPINKFDAGPSSVKDTWYTKLFSINPNNSTPLRSALARVGRIFAGKKPVGSSDPMQYSCQQNFTLLTTDGYWNSDADSDVLNISGGQLGNLDGGTTPRPMYEGPTAASNTLADVAKYYYDTDLRTSALGNCTGALGFDVCDNNVFVSNTDNNVQQHMTTFTLGLGVDGTLNYTSDYRTATSGDFYSIKNGLGLNWPVPTADSETAVDDLWHAAVNGQGTYFSAKDPAQLTSGLNAALASIGSKIGAGAAAATSTLNPVAGNNYAYVATYTTVKWQGNLESRSINLNTGVVSEAATWCIENVVAGACSAPGSVVASTSGSSTVYNCVTPGATASTCGGTLSGSTCYVELPVACNGTLATKVSSAGDTRSIKFKGPSGGLEEFTYDNLSVAQKAYFSGTALSQWTLLDATQKTAAAGANMVKYLRGQTGFEDRATNVVTVGASVVDNRLFRYREATMGDALDSQPVYVGKPFFGYTDAGYSAYVSGQANRGETVYIGTNDGMLHAFDANTGMERWAYVPSMVIPNMWKLADKNYATMHTNYVNGKPVIADVYDGSAWRTILVGALNGGGRGYFALDVTVPDAPTLLWEIDSATDSDIGYSFGPAVVTKKSNGTWVVLLSSGYNNVSPGTGEGFLFVRNAITGAAISKLGTGVGNTSTPSGLGKLGSFADNPNANNTSVMVYGGDLQGNVWRFDINSGAVLKFAALKDPSSNPQPITTRPETSVINGKRVVFVATGKYLETSDLVDTQRQSIYAIKDDNATTTFDNPRLSLVEQTITTTGSERKSSSNTVDWVSGRGWFSDLPDSGERVNVDPKIDAGTLFVATTVPSNTVCSPGGTGWLNYFNYMTGSTSTGAEDGLTGQKYNDPIVGINIFYLPPQTPAPGCPGGAGCTPTEGAKRNVGITTAANETPTKPRKNPGGGSATAGFVGTRVIWRELIP